MNGVSHGFNGKLPYRMADRMYKVNIADVLDAAAILMEDYHRLVRERDFNEALKRVTAVHKLLPEEPEYLKSMAFSCMNLGRLKEGEAYALRSLALDEGYLEAYHMLAHLYGEMKDWEKSGIYGRRALEMLDAGIMSNRQEPVLPPLPERGGRRIIAFSLFGNSSAYIEPAVINAEIAAEVYPGWVCRFYVDESVSEQALARLRGNGAEIVSVSGSEAAWPGTMWRFLALDDEDAAYVLFRDADAVISPREAAAVREWMAGGKRFHTMRDSGSHTELVLAGMWGAVGGAVDDMRGRIERFVAKGYEMRHFADQEFLRRELWPYIRQSVCAHDRLFGFAGGMPFPELPFHEKYQIGMDEASSVMNARLEYPDGTRVVWSLYSRIAPMLNADYSPVVLPQERLVCRYEAVVRNGRISAALPYRYGCGFNEGLTRIGVETVSA